MNDMTINLLGVGAIDILLNNGLHIYVDSFNTINRAPPLSKNDLIIFTHADGDHFSIEALLSVYQDNVIIGPPSITLPLLKTGRIDINKLVIDYPEQANTPRNISIQDICIGFYQSKHFIDWNPIHCSYLIEFNKTKVFITGDSFIDPSTLQNQNIDYAICNLVDKGFITKTDNPTYAVHHHMSYLLNILSNTKINQIIANHLIGFDGTIEPQVLKDLVKNYGFTRIIVPESSSETIQL